MMDGADVLTFGLLSSDRQWVQLCLLREFFVRPKRQFSLEGLGLAQLVYPALQKASLPAAMKQRGFNLDEWHALLHLTVNHFVRTGAPSVAAPSDIVRWLGYPGQPSLLLAPGQSKTRKTQRTWPSVSWPWAKRIWLIRLLESLFKLDCFAVDIRYTPHNDITTPQFIPVRDPLVSLDGADWMPLPIPGLGRYRTSRRGSLFHHSDGLNGTGHALCLRCGRADSMPADDQLPSAFGNSGSPHRRLARRSLE